MGKVFDNDDDEDSSHICTHLLSSQSSPQLTLHYPWSSMHYPTTIYSVATAAATAGGGEWMEGQRASIHLTRRHMFIQLNLMIRTLDSILGKGLGRF